MLDTSKKPLRVFDEFPKIPHITRPKAEFLYDLVTKHNSQNCLELGFSHGKSTAVLAQALEDKGSGHLTTVDFPSALDYRNGISRVLPALGLEHRVTIRTDPEGFHWTLMEMLEAAPKPVFDFVFLDGAHTWVGTGFAFLLVEQLLAKGAWLVFDDVYWRIADNEARRRAKGLEPAAVYANVTDREKITQQVSKVFDLLVSSERYDIREIRKDVDFAIARRM